MTIYNGNLPEDVVIELMTQLRPQSRILDLACGVGRNAIPLAKAGHHVEGRDKSAEEVLALRERAATENVAIESVICDMRDLRIGKWDAILAIHALHLLSCDDGRHMLKLISINVLPGGYAVIAAFTRNGDLASRFKRNFYPETDDIVRAFRGWNILAQNTQVVSCKVSDDEDALRNERLVLLASKSA